MLLNPIKRRMNQGVLFSTTRKRWGTTDRPWSGAAVAAAAAAAAAAAVVADAVAAVAVVAAVADGDGAAAALPNFLDGDGTWRVRSASGTDYWPVGS